MQGHLNFFSIYSCQKSIVAIERQNEKKNKMGTNDFNVNADNNKDFHKKHSYM